MRASAWFSIACLALLLSGCTRRDSTIAREPAPGDSALLPGLAHGFSPLPDVLTGGQPSEGDLAALARAGFRSVIDLRTSIEPRGYDEPKAAGRAGLLYEPLPIGPGMVSDAQFAAFRRLLADSSRRPALVHCAAGIRVAAMMIPYLVLDRGMAPDSAVALAARIGPPGEGHRKRALDYAAREAAAIQRQPGVSLSP